MVSFQKCGLKVKSKKYWFFFKLILNTFETTVATF